MSNIDITIEEGSTNVYALVAESHKSNPAIWIRRIEAADSKGRIEFDEEGQFALETKKLAA